MNFQGHWSMKISLKTRHQGIGPYEFPLSSYSGVARGLLQGRPLQLPMEWGVGEESTKSWPTFEQFCVQNLALGVSCCSGAKKEPKPKLLSPDIFWWGGGLPREGVGAKKFGMSLETQGIKLFWRDIPGFCRDIPEAPEKFEKKMFGFNFWPLVVFLPPRPRTKSCWLEVDQELVLRTPRPATEPRNGPTWNFHKKKYRKNTPRPEILDSQNLPPTYPENAEKKKNPKYQNAHFGYFFGIFSVFSWGSRISARGVFIRYFSWKFRVGPSLGSVAGRGVLKVSLKLQGSFLQ